MEIRSERPKTELELIMQKYIEAMDNLLENLEWDLVKFMKQNLSPERSALPDDVAGEHPC